MTDDLTPARSKRVARKPLRDAEADAAASTTGKLSNRWREPFFAKLAETSNVAAACAHAGVTRAAVYDLRRRDRRFYDRWMEALAAGYDNLEMELLHHLRTGEIQGGPKFNPLAAMRVLQQHRDTVAREKARRANVDAATVRASIDRKIAEMRALVLADKLVAERLGDVPDDDDR
ncbi:hypothetical protein [Novosphingobium sp. JCM 18896]|uniref:hypothetical protein n=1 Tax=Novosphingobium sp. JCM 18896 TaxID=2989731 RepID=UPI002223844D|nr:hypothetical protein [Novosphingobium sp. JCM 18896]MCW1429162.1 hypothetical protein [Novosphingobium sp. JCM 18896]